MLRSVSPPAAPKGAHGTSMAGQRKALPMQRRQQSHWRNAAHHRASPHRSGHRRPSVMGPPCCCARPEFGSSGSSRSTNRFPVPAPDFLQPEMIRQPSRPHTQTIQWQDQMSPPHATNATMAVDRMTGKPTTSLRYWLEPTGAPPCRYREKNQSPVPASNRRWRFGFASIPAEPPTPPMRNPCSGKGGDPQRVPPWMKIHRPSLPFRSLRRQARTIRKQHLRSLCSGFHSGFPCNLGHNAWFSFSSGVLTRWIEPPRMSKRQPVRHHTRRMNGIR